MEIINQIANEIIIMIKDIMPYGNYNYNDCVISNRDIYNLIDKIKERYLKGG